MSSIPNSLGLSTDTINNCIKNTIPESLLIYLYGSLANGSATSESDIDLAIYSSARIDPLILWETSNYISQITKRDVDLVEMKAVSPVLQKEIIEKGNLIFKHPDANKDEIELRLIQSYYLLNEDRKVITKEIQRTGEIYG